MPTISAFLSQANKPYSTRQLEAVIIEVCMVQALRLRINPRQVHEAKHPQMGPTVTQDFTIAKLAVLT